MQGFYQIILIAILWIENISEYYGNMNKQEEPAYVMKSWSDTRRCVAVMYVSVVAVLGFHDIDGGRYNISFIAASWGSTIIIIISLTF